MICFVSDTDNMTGPELIVIPNSLTVFREQFQGNIHVHLADVACWHKERNILGCQISSAIVFPNYLSV